MKKDASVQGKKKFALKGENSTVLLIFICFFIAIVVVQLIMSGGAFPTMIVPSNLLNILMQVTCVGIMAMGMTVVMISGGIDLSVGMLTSFVILFFAVAYIRWEMPVAAAMALAVGLAILFEFAMGLVISRLSVEPFIITLGGMIAFRGAALLVCNSQEVSVNQVLDPLKTNLLDGATDPVNGLGLQLPIYVLIFIAVTIIFWWLLKYTKYGRRIYAVGANKQAAYLAGINVKNIICSTYVIQGAMVGLAAIILLARINTAIITAGANLEIDVIAAAVVGGVAMSGGKGNIWGTFIGAVLLGAIANAMNILKLQTEWQYIVKGIIIIAAVSAGALTASMQARNQLKKQKEEALAAETKQTAGAAK